MKIVELAWTPFALPLVHPVQTGAGAIADLLHARRGVLVQVTTDTGVVGYGEASPLPHFGTETFEEVGPTLECVAEILQGAASPLHAEFHGDFARVLGELATALRTKIPTASGTLANASATNSAADSHPFPCTLGAIELALRDAWARTRAQLLAEDLARELCGAQSSRKVLHDREGKERSESTKADGLKASRSLACMQIPVNALLTKESPAEVVKEAVVACAAGYTTLKIKVGAKSLAEDLARIDAVRSSVEKNVKLRLDANAAWDFASALRALEAFATREIEFIEQPLAAGDIAGLAVLRAKKLVLIAADEAACSKTQALTVLRANAADLLVLKPALNGGLGASLAIARAARERNIEVLVTTALDGAVGAAAALHLAASVSCQRACGLATSALFERDLAATSMPQNGSLALPHASGLGLDIAKEALQRVATDPTQTRRIARCCA